MLNKREILTALIAKRIYDLRIEENMTQAQFAEFLDLDEKHLGKLERGQKLASTETIFDIADTLKIDLNKLRDEYGHLKNKDA